MRRRTWVLGGGGARGAAQVGVLLGLFEAGIDPPVRIVGTSVGALNGAGIASYPSLAGAQMLEQIWLSDLALQVFRIHPLGLVMGAVRGEPRALAGDNVSRLIAKTESMIGHRNFEELRVPMSVVTTDLGSGEPHIFDSGPLAVALASSTAIPGVFPTVNHEGRRYVDGGIVANTPLVEASNLGKEDILAISLLGGAEREHGPSSYVDLLSRTLQVSLHHHMLTEFERVKDKRRTTVLCPVNVEAVWDMKRQHVKHIIDQARRATLDLMRERGSKLFDHSAVVEVYCPA